MSSKTKIVVLRMKELIYTGIFLALGILLIILLVCMFAPKNRTVTKKTASALYEPGVYTSALALGEQAVDVEVTVDENKIRSVRLVNLESSVAAMYPLMTPVMESLAAQILENQSLSGLSYDDSTRYTAQVLTEAVGRALEKAEIK